MAVSAGPNIVADSLSLAISAANTKSSLRSTQQNNLLVDPHSWVVGTGGSTGYGSNGSETEQVRTSITDDPWGGTSVVWGTTPDDISGADGGWNTASYAVDQNSLYRYSVWVRRHTVGTGGTFYLGMNPAPIRNDNSVLQSNPYFATPAQSSLALNQWYLVVAHCFPQSYRGGRHVDSGWYANGVKISDLSYGNVGTADVRWNPGTTTALHRVYHYYTTNINSGMQFAFPRLDLCAGKEPSISDLIGTGESIIRNLVDANSSTKFKLTNMTSFSYDDLGSFEFDGSVKYIDITGFTLSGDRTIAFWCNPTEATTNWRSVIDSETGRYIIGTLAGKFQLYSVDNWRGGPDATLNQWQHIAFATSGTTTSWYKNGSFVGSYVGTVPAISGTTIIGARFAKETAYLSGKLSSLRIYGRALSATEISGNFNAVRSRFGI